MLDAAAASDFAYFAMGSSAPLGKFTWATSNHQAGKEPSTCTADVLDTFHDPIAGLQLWRANRGTAQVARSTVLGDMASTLNFKPSTGIPVGDPGIPFTNMEDYNDQMYVFKENGIYTIKNDRAAKLNVGLDAFISSNNGRAMLAQNLFLYFSWSHSLERLHGGTLDDIGMWKGAGLKDGHQGPVSTAISYIAWTAAAVDASSGTGGLYFWNNRGWHEIFRNYSTALGITGLAYQTNRGTQPRIWMDLNGELVSMEMPRDTLNPRYDSGLHFQHEAVLETGTIDMNARRLPKLFAAVEANSKNLASSAARIYAEYQLDKDTGSTSWLSVGSFYHSPFDDLPIRRGDAHSIRLRLRALTENSTVPAILEAATLKAVARSPIKRQWTIRATVGDFQVDSQGMEDVDPDEFYLWLQDAAILTEPLLLHSVWLGMDGIYVYAEQPTLSRSNPTPSGEWSGEFEMSIREI